MLKVALDANDIRYISIQEI